MRVMAFDLGRRCGFAVLDGNVARSGSRELFQSWKPFGKSLRILRERLMALIEQNKPEIIGVAEPFTSRGDTPLNLLPMYGGFAVLNMVCEELGLPLEIVSEGQARRAMLGKFLPRSSAKVKKAIHQACHDRGWRCCDTDASDALCIAIAVRARLSPSTAHDTTPLFATMPEKPTRRRRVA